MHSRSNNIAYNITYKTVEMQKCKRDFYSNYNVYANIDRQTYRQTEN